MDKPGKFSIDRKNQFNWQAKEKYYPEILVPKWNLKSENFIQIEFETIIEIETKTKSNQEYKSRIFFGNLNLFFWFNVSMSVRWQM